MDFEQLEEERQKATEDKAELFEFYHDNWNRVVEEAKKATSLQSALETIAGWAGNLPDERLTNATGPNDAAMRGEMVVSMRAIAREVIDKANE